VAGESRRGTVTIRADARSSHQSVVTAMDVAARLGFTQVDIATVSQSAKE
jgi:biopolymer transport protein ExbD